MQVEKLSIIYTQYFLRNNNEKLDFLIKHKKKDDLADSYLQCLTYYKKGMMRNYIRIVFSKILNE